MLSQRKHDVTRHSNRGGPQNRTRRRKKVGMLRKLLCNRMICILLLASVVCAVLTVYAGAYARVTEEGYRKGELLSHLGDLKMQNEELRVTLDALRQPDRVAEFALANGMHPGDRMAYLKPADEPRLARNIGGQDVR